MTTRRKVAASSGAIGLFLLCGVVLWKWPEIRKSYRLLKEFDYDGRNAQGYREYIHVDTGIAFVEIPGGEFVMGASRDEVERVCKQVLAARRELEERYGLTVFEADGFERFFKGMKMALSSDVQHRVTVSPFLISKYEVSEREWKRVFPDASIGKGDGDLPREVNHWADYEAFCRRTGLSLPSEAQWEYACRGGSSTAYAWGDRLDPSMANYRSTVKPDGDYYPVNAFRPNGFGLYNMHGNVKEVCVDIMNRGYYPSSEAGGPDPICREPYPGTQTKFHVARGGDAWCEEWLCRSASRQFFAEGAGLFGVRACFPLR